MDCFACSAKPIVLETAGTKDDGLQKDRREDEQVNQNTGSHILSKSS